MGLFYEVIYKGIRLEVVIKPFVDSVNTE